LESLVNGRLGGFRRLRERLHRVDPLVEDHDGRLVALVEGIQYGKRGALGGHELVALHRAAAVDHHRQVDRQAIGSRALYSRGGDSAAQIALAARVAHELALAARKKAGRDGRAGLRVEGSHGYALSTKIGYLRKAVDRRSAEGLMA